MSEIGFSNPKPERSTMTMVPLAASEFHHRCRYELGDEARAPLAITIRYSTIPS